MSLRDRILAGAFGMSAKSLDPVFIGAGGAPTDPRALFGAKAAELARIAALGLPAPPAFVLPTSLCAGVVAGEADALKAMRKGLRAGIDWLEATTAKSLGDARDPLVRLGAFGRGKLDARHARHHP